MDIIDLRVTNGPNFWSLDNHQLILVKVDHRDLKDIWVKDVEHLKESLIQMFPNIEADFQKSQDISFNDILKPDAKAVDLIGPLAVELQTMCGMEVSFYKVFQLSEEGKSIVAFSYIDKEAGIYTAETIVHMLDDLFHQSEFHIERDIKRLNRIWQSNYIGLSTGSIVSEAVKAGIPYSREKDDIYITLGQGVNQKRIQATISGNTSFIGVDIAGDKDGTKNLLKEASLPVPEGIIVYDQEELISAIKTLGYPIVTKPLDGNHGRGITIDIRSMGEAIEGFEIAQAVSPAVIVEKFIQGSDYRLVVINHKFFAALKRARAFIKGDGRSTVQELIEAVNNEPRRQPRPGNILTPVKIDDVTLNILKKNGLSLDSILPKEEILYVKETANVSTGAIPVDVTDSVHPYNKFQAERISKIVGLDICGVDLMSPDIAVPFNENGAAIVEVNAAPGIRMHIEPAEGKSRNVAKAIVDMLFPEGTNPLIPVVAISDCNTLTSHLVTHLLQAKGIVVGAALSSGLFINKMWVKRENASGPKDARFILKDPTVECAVLECNIKGIYHEGLPFSMCDVAILSHVEKLNEPLDGINNEADETRLKTLLLQRVKQDGYAILNADEIGSADIIKSLKCKVGVISEKGFTKELKEYAGNGAIVAYVDADEICLFNGKDQIALGRPGAVMNKVPGLTQREMLMSCITAYTFGISTEIIKDALTWFNLSEDVFTAKH